MYALLVWLALLLVPGWFLAHALKGFSEEDGIIDRLAYSAGLGSAALVAVFLTRTWVRWPMYVAPLYMVLVALASFLAFEASAAVRAGREGKRGQILRRMLSPLLPPAPSRAELGTVLLAFTYLPFLVYVHLSKYPIFNSLTTSQDYLNTANLVKDYVANGPPALQGQLLYYGVHYHLAFLLSLSGPGSNALLVTREGMGAIVVLSSLYVYLAAKKLSGSPTAGLATVLIYSLTGFYWFGQVFNSGLYPNFYGGMASLFLIVASKDFLAEKARTTGFLMLLLGILNALISHYSTLFLIPVLAGVALVADKRPMLLNQRFLYLEVLLLPAAIGAVLFLPSFGFLFGFASGSSGFAPDLSPSPLAKLLEFFPSLAYSVLIMGNDFGAVVLLALAALAVVLGRRNTWLALPAAWFVLSLAVAPLSANAWRFSFVALLPFILLSGIGFNKVGERLHAMNLSAVRTKRGSRPTFNLVTASILVILILPTVYNGVSSTVFAISATDCKPLGYGPPLCYSKTDSSVYQTMQWVPTAHCGYWVPEYWTPETSSETGEGIMVNHPTLYQPTGCRSIAITDPRFAISDFVTGTHVEFDGALQSNPAEASLYARRQNFTFLVVDDLPEYYLPECYSIFPQLDILNSTSGHAISLRLTLLNASGIARVDAPASIYVNGTLYADTRITAGQVDGSLRFNSTGAFDVRAQAGIVSSNTQTVFMGSSAKPVNHPANFYDCRPFYWSSAALGHAMLVYENQDVKVWCLPSSTMDCEGVNNNSAGNGR